MSLAKQDGEFINWNENVQEFEYTKGRSFFELMVQTRVISIIYIYILCLQQDTVCYSWFVKNAINLQTSLYITGITGTGKTVIINNTMNEL